MTGEQRNEVRAARRMAIITSDYLECLIDDRGAAKYDELDEAVCCISDAILHIEAALKKEA